MPKPLSNQLKANLNTIVANEHPLVLLEISHSNLPDSIRLVNDKKDLVSNGFNYMACPFELSLPDENDGQLPRATLEITNIGRALTVWIERTIGGMDAMVEVSLVLRSNPNFIEWNILMDLANVQMDIEKISAQLVFDDFLNRPAVPIIYNVEKAPGLY